MNIRRAATEDLNRASSVLDAAGLPPLGSDLPLANILVALEDSAVVGVIALEVRGLVGLVRSAAAAPNHQGVGSSLLQSLLARAHELSLRELYLLTEDAEGFFVKAGFSSIPRNAVPPEIRSTREFRERCSDTVTVMRFRLVTRYV
jgi:amino-acid N-acetyltransferase